VGGLISAELLDASQAGDPPVLRSEALLDGAKLGGPIYVRQRMPAMCFTPWARAEK
jgi:hypothetical protein